MAVVGANSMTPSIGYSCTEYSGVIPLWRGWKNRMNAAVVTVLGFSRENVRLQERSSPIEKIGFIHCRG